MGQILGLGITHYPNLCAQPNMSWRMQKCLEDPARSRSGCARRRTGTRPCASNGGTTRGRRTPTQHRRDLIDQFRRIRARARRLQARLRADLGRRPVRELPRGLRAAVLGPRLRLRRLPAVERLQPRAQRMGRARGQDLHGARPPRRRASTWRPPCSKEGIDVAYAYKPLHHPLGHAFANSVLYLDYDRKGFHYPVVPFAVNAYGRWLIAAGGAPRLPSEAAERSRRQSDLDPPAPQPWRCFEVGAARRARARAQPVARRGHRVLELEPRVPGAEELASCSRTSRRTSATTRR